jgi:hypothetical protein
MTKLVVSKGDEWLVPLFERWIAQEIPYDHIADLQQLFNAWLAGYRVGFNSAY